MSKKQSNKQAKQAQLRKLHRQRTRLVGDIAMLPDDCEDYEALKKALADLNADIEKLEKEAKA